jgi:hypothetical protein
MSEGVRKAAGAALLNRSGLEGGLRGELGVVPKSGRDDEAALEQASSSSSHAASNSVKAGRDIPGVSTGECNGEAGREIPVISTRDCKGAGRRTPVKAAGKCNSELGRKTPVEAAGEDNQAPVKAAAETNLADLSVQVSLPLVAIPQNGPFTVCTELAPLRLKGGLKSLSGESGSKHGGTESGAEQAAVRETVTEQAAASKMVTGSRSGGTIRSGLERVLGF